MCTRSRGFSCPWAGWSPGGRPALAASYEKLLENIPSEIPDDLYPLAPLYAVFAEMPEHTPAEPDDTVDSEHAEYATKASALLKEVLLPGSRSPISSGTPLTWALIATTRSPRNRSGCWRRWPRRSL
jgi:hypothetical protein